MSERDVDAMIERMAREERDDLDKRHGEHILAVTDYAKGREQDPLVQVLHQAHRAKAEEDDQQ